MIYCQDGEWALLMNNVTLSFEFPGLKPSLHQRIHGQQGVVTAALYLPKDYDVRRKIPACIFLGGFTGGPAQSAGSARAICGDRGFICINLPLFKQRLPRLKKDESNYWSRSFVKDSDYPAIWAAYKVMLKRVYSEIPNIDVSRSAMGGFSNGAHTTAVLLNKPRCRIYDFVSHFYFIEGGCYFRRTNALNGRSLLMYQGAEWEEPWLADARAAAAGNATAKLRWSLMPGVKHGFPDNAKRRLRRWLKQLPRYQR